MVDIRLPDDWVTADEKQKLAQLLNAHTHEEYEAAIARVARAALDEYKEMLLGQGLPTRADEIKQRRLFHLIKRHFRGRIPSESEVADMFQLTEAQSRALIQSVRTRFRYDLEQELLETLRSTLMSATFDEDAEEYRVVIRSDNVLEAMRAILEEEAPQLPSITKVRGSSRNYSISVDSYEVIRAQIGMPADVSE